MNQKLNPHVEAVMRLLIEQGLEAANRYVELNVSPEVAKAKKEFEARSQEEGAVKNIIVMAMSGMSSGEAQNLPEPEVLPMDTRGQVLAIAAEVARGNDGIAELNPVVEAVLKRGIDLKSSRPGTSIANILFKASDLWERVSPGVFRLLM